MKVAAYQASLHATSSMAIVGLIRERVEWCERQGVEILCCPEGALGGLADYADRPMDIALDPTCGQLEIVLAPLASDRVSTIVGFTEVDQNRQLYNSAAVFRRGRVGGIYRKLHPAINKSIYQPGNVTPVFTIGELT